MTTQKRQTTSREILDTVLKYHTDEQERSRVLIDLVSSMDEQVADLADRISTIETAIVRLAAMDTKLDAMTRRMDELEAGRIAARLGYLEGGVREWNVNHSIAYYVRRYPFQAFVAFLLLFCAGLFVTSWLWLSDVRALWMGHLNDEGARFLLYASLVALVTSLVLTFVLGVVRNGQGGRK